MILQLFSIQDAKTNIYQVPFYCHNRGHAMRQLKTGLENKDSMLARYPEDFRLYAVGFYDDATGMTTCEANPQLVCNANDLIEKNPE